MCEKLNMTHLVQLKKKSLNEYTKKIHFGLTFSWIEKTVQTFFVLIDITPNDSIKNKKSDKQYR